jgi:hypothetical protein
MISADVPGEESVMKHVLDELEKDEEGIEIMKTLGENMAWLLKRIQ